MEWSNILQRTGVIGSNPIVAALELKYFFEKFSEVESPQSGSTLDNTRLVCANVDKLIVVLKLFFVYPSARCGPIGRLGICANQIGGLKMPTSEMARPWGWLVFTV